MENFTTTTEAELRIFYVSCTEAEYSTFVITDGNNLARLDNDFVKLQKFLKCFEAQFADNVNNFAKMYSEFELPKQKLSGFAKYIADGGRIWD